MRLLRAHSGMYPYPVSGFKPPLYGFTAFDRSGTSGPEPSATPTPDDVDDFLNRFFTEGDGDASRATIPLASPRRPETPASARPPADDGELARTQPAAAGPARPAYTFFEHVIRGFAAALDAPGTPSSELAGRADDLRRACQAALDECTLRSRPDAHSADFDRIVTATRVLLDRYRDMRGPAGAAAYPLAQAGAGTLRALNGPADSSAPSQRGGEHPTPKRKRLLDHTGRAASRGTTEPLRRVEMPVTAVVDGAAACNPTRAANPAGLRNDPRNPYRK